MGPVEDRGAKRGVTRWFCRTSPRVSQLPGYVFREPRLRNEISFPENQEVGPAPSKDAVRVESVLNPHKILISWFLRLPGN